MDTRILDLLRSSSTNESPYTVFTHIPNMRIYPLKQQNISNFWSQYCNTASDPDRMFLSVSEYKPINPPITFQCKMKFDDSTTPDDHISPSIPEDFYLAFVKCCQDVMTNILNITDNKCYIAVVLESKYMVKEKDHINHVFRIQFPYCRVSIDTQEKLIKPALIKELRKNTVLSMVMPSPIDEWDNIIDSNIPKIYLPLYRSIISQGDSVIEYSHIWGRITKEQIDENYSPELNHEEIFGETPEQHTHFSQGFVDRKIIEGDFDLDHWFPMYLSAYYTEKITLENIELEQKIKITPQKDLFIGDFRELDQLEICDSLITLLGENRYTEKIYWLNVGKALYTSSYGGNDGLKRWIEFTHRGDTFKSRECKDYYDTFTDNNNITVKTIAWYAKQDDLDGYNDWHKRWSSQYLSKATTMYHTDIAKALWSMLWLDYVWVPNGRTSGTWYRFRKNIYNISECDIDISRYISNEFATLFEDHRLKCLDQAHKSSDSEFKMLIENKVKSITSLISKLKNEPFKKNILSASRAEFHDEHFLKKLDNNPDLTGMLNCVLEVIDDECYYRPGKPEDYISKSTNLNYRSDFTDNTPCVKELKVWLHQVFTDKELFEYFLKDNSAFLRAGNSEKIFRVYSGEGNNSKSMIIKLLCHTWGNYSIKVSSTLFTEKRPKSNQAQPEIARAKSCRLIVSQEPDDGDTLQKAIIKEFTGGDSISIRDLYKGNIDLISTFRAVFMSNGIPAILNADRAIYNRIRVILFTSKWSENAPETITEQYEKKIFKLDPYFDRKIPKFAEAFMWLLVKYYPKYRKEGLIPPESVTRATDKYWNDNDIYQRYIEDRITKDGTGSIDFISLYTDFKVWYRDMYPSTIIPANVAAKDAFILHLGPQHNKRWIGISLIENK